ncbi:MAG: hypothetical protein WCL21_18840 [Mariniphaga sp.]
MKTKRIISALVLVAIAFVSQAQHYRSNGMPDMRYRENRSSYSAPAPVPTSTVRYQNEYQRNEGTVVQSHYKTTSDGTNTNNWSTSGNTNLSTGQAGSRARDYSTGATNYGSGQTIQTGSRGGQYYINSNGNRTYVPKR